MAIYEYFMQTSDVEWCETKYAITSYVAEFWNTITGIPYVYMAINGIMQSKTRIERIMWIEVMFIGIGTSLFHGTLTLGGQLVDEIAIIMFLMTASMTLMKMRYQFFVYIISFGIMLIYPAINCYMLFGVGLSVAIPLGHQMLQNKNRLRIIITGIMVIIGIICWSIDKFECGGWGYLHAIWHLIMMPVIKNVVIITNLSRINFVEQFGGFYGV